MVEFAVILLLVGALVLIVGPRLMRRRGAGSDWLQGRLLVTGDHWKLIDEHERTAGEGSGRPRVKLTSVADLLRIGHG